MPEQTYELQPGQVRVVADILAMLDVVNDKVERAANPEDLLLSLGILGATAALATSILTKGMPVK
ncbi:MAG: hypothetical protein WC279_10450 [Sulfurimonas sp.]|jgi:hypothetical protein|uniref:hypothetical protein n=1 Tax=Sulfurimonas sp. TaxID=2022749 RepID=UPI003566D29D